MPYLLKDKQIYVPCGKCPTCLRRRMDGWAFRLYQQSKIATSAMFLTLTYDNSTVPISDSGYLTLRPSDLQLYMKRLRKVCGEKLKYYSCGEYGARTFRPHYHQILFNADITKIQNAWQNGHVHYGDFTGASVAYTLKYMCKKSSVKYSGDDRQIEFSHMSKGLGVNYLSPAIVNYHRADLRRLYLNNNDKKVAMPRYYRNRIYTDEELEKLQVINADSRAQAMEKYQESMKLRYGDDWESIALQQRDAAFYNMYSSSLKNCTI